jgi:hypothetical protein
MAFGSLCFQHEAGVFAAIAMPQDAFFDFR